MSVNLNPGTGTEPVAAPIEANPTPASVTPSTPTPAVDQPVVGGAPIAAVPQTEPSQPGAAPPPPVDWEAQAKAAQAEARAAQAQQAAIQRQIQDAIEQQRRENEELQFRSHAQQELDQAYAIANQMMDTDPAKATAYIRQAEERHRVQVVQRAEQQRIAAEQRYAQQFHQLAGPMYAQKLAADHRLPPDLAEQLKGIPPQLMDTVAPSLAAAARAREQAAEVARQQQLSQQAAQMQQSGAHSVGGVVASAPSAPHSPNARNTRARNAALYRQASGRG